MVEKPDARIDFVFALAVEIQRYIDVGLFGLPVYFRRSLFHNGILSSPAYFNHGLHGFPQIKFAAKRHKKVGR